MKKVLLASVALLTLGTTAAQADEPLKLGITGFYRNEVGFVENRQWGTAATKYQKFADQDAGQLSFVGSTKLDNGIGIAVQLDTEPTQYNNSKNACGITNNVPTVNAAGAPVAVNVKAGSACNPFVKRFYGTFSSVYGTIIAGERESLASILHVTAPGVGFGDLQDSDWANFIVDRPTHALMQVTNDTRYLNRATPKLSYLSPALYGVSVGVTYTPNTDQSTGNNFSANTTSDNPNLNNINFNTAVNRSLIPGDAYTAVVAFKNNFGPVSVNSDISVSQLNFASLRLISGGAQVGYAGFALGGSFLNRDIPGGTTGLSSANYAGSGFTSTAVGVAGLTPINAPTMKAAAFVGTSWEAALSYTTGPYAVSFGYFHDNSANSAWRADSTGEYALSGSYTFGPGMALKGTLFHYELNSGAPTGSAAKYAAENSGNGIYTGVQVNF